MKYKLPGVKSQLLLQSGKKLFRNGLSYDASVKKSASKGYEAPAQIIVARAEGDFVWDLDGNRFIDFQNGWATNPLGNCHPEIIQAVPYSTSMSDSASSARWGSVPANAAIAWPLYKAFSRAMILRL